MGESSAEMTLDATQEAELTGLGDCQLHWHAADRRIDHARILEMYSNTNVVTKSGNYTITERDDYILVNQTATITLPLAKNTHREVEIILIAAGKTLTVVPTGTDTVQGATSVVTTVQWTALRFKAITGGWVLA